MWPWGHAALGYLIYRVARHSRDQSWPPGDGPAIAVALGTQFPDLIDKPLAWSLNVLPSGRSFAHSIFIATIICSIAIVVSRRYGYRTPAWAFSIGYCAHLLGDALLPILQLDTEFLTFLAWPLLPPPPYENDSGFIEHFVNVTPDPFTLFGLALTLAVLGLWAHDRYPGIRWLVR
ncbi:metal-dependent hydrolase [Halomarina salina]|uniref:Metal-dependent hydrolase n=1 Tax=Halomarina salina TaxID=1872699 RepID=A0ABD5RSR8_9EURY